MQFFPMDRRPTPVAVEYAARGRRVVKVFPDAVSARRFYAAKFKAGAEPAVRKAEAAASSAGA